MEKSKRRWTIEDCRDIAKNHSGKCLSTEYKNNKIKLKWACKDGFIWEANLNSISLGHWCPHCAGLAKFCIEDCQNFAESKNGKCISKSYKNAKSRLEWECEFGHRWAAATGNVFGGQWCPKCCKNYKLDIDMCIKYAKEQGGVCLSSEYINSKTHLKWQCKYGHKWSAAPGGMLREKYWCRVCAGTAPVGIEACKKHAEKMGGDCLSNIYINSMTELEWECEFGHVWKTSPTNILNKLHWCPFCKNKSENKIFDILKQIFPNSNIIMHFRGFKWLKNKNKMEIDVWIPSIKLAIEYDGEQHFRPIDWAGKGAEWAQKSLKDIRERDKLKNKLIDSHPECVKYFIRIPYTFEITRENLIELLKLNKMEELICY